MQRPKEVTLSREEGEALIERLERDALNAEDRRVLVQVSNSRLRGKARKMGVGAREFLRFGKL